MEDSSAILEKIQDATKYSRDPKLRRRAEVFFRAHELGSVAQACRDFGISPQLYHYWWRRFRDSGFTKAGLTARSRRPKRSPRRVPEKVAQWICRYRKDFGYSGEKIRYLLEKEKKVHLSLPTIYRVLTRGGILKRKPGHGAKRPSDVAEVSPRPLRSVVSAESVAPPKLKLPRNIGDRYRVLRALGSGGGGVVYLVEDEKGKREPLALKLLEINRGTDASLADLLKNEFSALASLHHPNLARVFDLGGTPEGIYFTSEFIQGRDLLAATRHADLNLVFQLIVQLLAALDFLHRRGILHLDLKPTNILVTDPDATGEVFVKLIDFGSAEWRKRGQAEPGEFMGTPPYVAPEMLMELPATPASDLYAVGMMLHQIFFSAFPYHAKDPLLLMKEQVYEDPLRLGPLHPALPEEFGDFLLKMVARNPRERFASAREALAGLNQVLGENFSVRPALAPVRILEESDYMFRPKLFAELVQTFLDPSPKLWVLSGPKGIGKTRLLRRVKESLQLQGIFPFFCQGPESLRDYLQEASQRAVVPIFLDWGAEEPAELADLLQSLDEVKAPVFLTTRGSRSPELLVSRWIDLPMLSAQEILEFFQEEIADFPFSDPKSWPGLEGGSPAHFENILQALQEEGTIQWTDRGWQWMSEAKVNFAELLPAHQARWKQRQAHVLEILKVSPSGISAKILGGILGLEAAALEEKLFQWEAEGILKCRVLKKVPHFFSRSAPAEEQPTPSVQDWRKLQSELENLYHQGQFEAGARWADLLSGPPPEVAIWCARHYAAAGEAEKALVSLPPNPRELAVPGLYFEILARTQFILGNLSEAAANLECAEQEYGEDDSAGLSRVWNLRGSVAKKLADFPAAERAFQNAIARAGIAGDFYLSGLAQMNLALFYQEQGNFRLAYATYEAALTSEGLAQHPLLSCRLRQNWLNLVFYMGRAQEAEKTCYELFRLSLRHHYSELQASALNFLALLAGQKGHREMQLSYLNQALSLLKSRNLWFPYTQTLLNRGFYFWEQHRMTPAELDAQYALTLAKRQNYPLFTAWSYLLLGKICRDRPKPDLNAAAQWLNRAHQRIHQLNNRQLLWEVEFDRGLAAKKQGELSEAKEFFLEAKRHLEELLLEVPDFVRQSYLRDRKMERILEQI